MQAQLLLTQKVFAAVVFSSLRCGLYHRAVIADLALLADSSSIPAANLILHPRIKLDGSLGAQHLLRAVLLIK